MSPPDVTGQQSLDMRSLDLKSLDLRSLDLKSLDLRSLDLRSWPSCVVPFIYEEVVLSQCKNLCVRAALNIINYMTLFINEGLFLFSSLP